MKKQKLLFEGVLLVGALWSGYAQAAESDTHYALILPITSYHYDRDLKANEFNPGLGIGAAIPEYHGQIILSVGGVYNSSKQLALFGLAGYLVPITPRLSVGAGIYVVYIPAFGMLNTTPEVLLSYQINDRWALSAKANRGYSALFASYRLK